ncbi:hypothetical protein [Legionella sp. CNM-4043-24]|uniref:hypothetical protein n=1 Tax=Legionella sp. CNM-4043-24 TaxID=3421646 RepID=UPI00403AB93E
MKWLPALLSVLLVSAAQADDNFPASCQPIAVQSDSLILKTTKPLVVLIHNISSSDLWITHPVSDPGASAGWSSRLQAGNWSALSVDKASFELSCIESKPGHEQQVPCVGMIGVCEWPGVKIPAQLTGTFWAGEDMALPALTAHIGGRGFVIPVSTP